MIDLPSWFLAVSYGLLLLAIGYAIGTQHARLVALIEKWSHPMPSKPNGPRPPSREVRNALKKAELELGVADFNLSSMADDSHKVSRALLAVWRVKSAIRWMLGLGTDKDEDDNGNGNGGHE
jgi:hypothetical protein